MNRSRPRHVSVWLNDAELESLKQQAKTAGLKVDPFIRSLINGIDLKPRPPDEWAEVVRQLSAVGNNINQIARIANANNAVDSSMLESIQKMQSAIWRLVKGL